MTNTRDKLNEAKHFLEEMKRVSSDPNKFRYELTAFLAASRSITQIMQKEFSEKAGFTAWYTHQQGEMEKNPTLKYLHRQRAITFHERPVLSYPIKITDQISDAAGMRIVLTGTGSNLTFTGGFVTLPVIQPDVNVRYYFDDISHDERDVVTICQEAVDALEIIVTGCERMCCD